MGLMEADEKKLVDLARVVLKFDTSLERPPRPAFDPLDTVLVTGSERALLCARDYLEMAGENVTPEWAVEFLRRKGMDPWETLPPGPAARPDSVWYGYECVNGEAGCPQKHAVVLDLRADGLDVPPAPVVPCPLCGEPMHWKGQWKAEWSGHGSRGDRVAPREPGRAEYLLSVAVQAGASEQWFRDARATLAWRERYRSGPPEGTCGPCGHGAHPGELCGHPIGEGALEACPCALERGEER